jgi:hypothetical protein
MGREKPMIDPEEKEITVALGILEDGRRQIAAYKVQRWDVVKWGVTVNLALTVAAAASTSIDARALLLVMACFVVIGGWLLVRHYNSRMTGTRQQNIGIVDWLKQKQIDYDAIAGQSTRGDYASKENYDRQELRIFAYILGASGILVLIGTIFGGKP